MFRLAPNTPGLPRHAESCWFILLCSDPKSTPFYSGSFLLHFFFPIMYLLHFNTLSIWLNSTWHRYSKYISFSNCGLDGGYISFYCHWLYSDPVLIGLCFIILYIMIIIAGIKPHFGHLTPKCQNLSNLLLCPKPLRASLALDSHSCIINWCLFKLLSWDKNIWCFFIMHHCLILSNIAKMHNNSDHCHRSTGGKKELQRKKKRSVHSCGFFKMAGI